MIRLVRAASPGPGARGRAAVRPTIARAAGAAVVRAVIGLVIVAGAVFFGAVISRTSSCLGGFGLGLGDAADGGDPVEDVQVSQHPQLIHRAVQAGLLVLLRALADVRVGLQRGVGGQPVSRQRAGPGALAPELHPGVFLLGLLAALAGPVGVDGDHRAGGELADLAGGLARQPGGHDQLLGRRDMHVVKHGGLGGDGPGFHVVDDPGLQRRADPGQAGLQGPGQLDQLVGGLQRDAQLPGDLMGHAQLGGHRPRFLGRPPAQEADQLIVGGIRAPALRAGQLIEHHRGPRPRRAPVGGVVLGEGRQPRVPAAGQPGTAAGLFALAAIGNRRLRHETTLRSE
jgi:hypothetical protein